jgi:hypothetical protein
MLSDFNENLYLGLFWSEELIGNDENCIQGHFYFQNGRPFWKFQGLSAPLAMGIHFPVKFSKDRIISLCEFGRTSSFGEEDKE